MPLGASFSFIVERDKLEKLNKVIFYNGGETIDESPVGEDVQLTVKKISDTD